MFEAAIFTRLFAAVSGAAFAAAFAAVPAQAADDIEAKVQVCAACHGQNGVPLDPKTTPIIWGQQSSYIYKELHDYHSGARDNPIMSPIAKGFSLEDLRKIADYFAAKSWPAQHAAAVSATAPESVAQCRPCHQPNFEGGAPAPRLTGLSYEYLTGAMRSFADDERTNNLDMPKFMKALTDSERDTIARYLSTL
jgi:cytochrome c553